MESLIEKAKSEKKWIYCSYQDLWFSPTELENRQTNGQFRWEWTNFTLRNPQEKLCELGEQMVDLKQEIENFSNRI